ncbi:MAG TPA: AAA family ATPase [Solirubrobacterales bacterium]|nr:AAA family ATPase [Solirubrobacterales bacterium]
MPATSALLERKGELATIERTLGEAAAGAGGLLLIEAEAGAGKTSLLDEIGRMGNERRALVLRARGGEYERDFTYGVVRQLLEPPLADETRRAELLTGTAALAAPIFDDDVAAKAASEPFAMQHGLYWILADLAGSELLVLLVDDAQWADLASLRAIAYFARRIEGLRVALAVAIRSGEPGPQQSLLDELHREPGVRLIVPAPLTEAATSALAGKELGEAPSTSFGAACHRASAGNPFLVVELLRALAAEQISPSDENADRLEGIAAAGVGRSILIRLSRLGEAAVRAARAVAILEPNADPEHVAILAGLGAKESAAACSRLIGSRLLSDGRPLGFVHPLVRSAVYTDMPEPTRAQLHAEAARRLSAIGSSVDSVAAHLLLAPPATDASVVEVLRGAAREASARGAPESAVELLRRARREPPPENERAAVELEFGVAQLRAADAGGVETLLALRSSTEDSIVRAEIAAVLGISLIYRGREEEAISLLDQSIAELGGSSPLLRLRLRAESLELSAWVREGVPDQLAPAVDEALTVNSFEARRFLEVASILEALGLGRIDRAERIARGAIGDLNSFREDAMSGFPPTRAAVTLVLTDCGDEVEGFFDTATDAARRRNMNAVTADFGMRALCRFLDGDLTRAQADAEMAFELALPLGVPLFGDTWQRTLLLTLVERGDHVAAQKLVSDHPRRDAGPGLHGAFTHCAWGELRSAIGEHEAARRDFIAAGERISWLPYANLEALGWKTGLAMTEAVLGNRKKAGGLAEEAVGIAREAGGRRGIGVALRVQGVIGGVDGVENLCEAVEILAGTRARLQHAKALVDLGAALRRGNRRKDAREPLREGLDMAHRCGAASLEERARTELAATGARPRSARLSGIEALTPSELRVARMASRGMTNREIAQSLFVTTKTIETHLRHVYQKLEIAGRTEFPADLREDSKT